MATTTSFPNAGSSRIRVGGRVWSFVAIGQNVAGDSYLVATGITFKDPNLTRVNLLRRMLGVREILAILSNGLMSDHQANGHVLINTGAWDSRFDYTTQKLTYFKAGRSSAPATVASEVELDNDSSINAATALKPVLVIGEGDATSSDCETLS